MPRSAKMLQFVNWRIRVTIADNRELVGTFLAFDKHMNLVLGDCEEFRRVVPKGKKGAFPPAGVCVSFLRAYLYEREDVRTLSI